MIDNLRGRINKKLFIILVIALIVRLWGIDFGLPHTGTRHDEALIVNLTVGFGTGDFNPHFFHYPTGFMYLLSILYGFYFLVGNLTGFFPSLMSFISAYSEDPTNFYLIARIVSVISGVGTVYVTYKVAEELFNKQVGMISAFFMSLAYLSVRESHFGKIDTLGTFFIMLSILFIVRAVGKGVIKHFLLAGVFAGLATTVRYAGGLLVVPMVLVHIESYIKKKKVDLFDIFNKRIFVFISVFILVFLLGTPFALFDFNTFSQDLIELNKLISNPYYDVWVGRGWLYQSKVALYYGLGWTLFFSSIAGALILFKRDKKKAILLLSFPLIYFIKVGMAYTSVVRYSLPLIPFLCITGAFFIYELSKSLSKFFSNRYKAIVTYCLAIVVVLPSLLNVIQFNSILSKRDSRLVATDWIYENLEGGSSVYQYGSWLGRVQVLPSKRKLEQKYNEIVVEEKNGIRESFFKALVLKAKIDYLNKKKIDGYDEWLFRHDLGAFVENGDLLESLPRYIFYYETELEVDRLTSPIYEEVELLLESDYELLVSFKPRDLENKRQIYDRQDAFYIPYVGFEGIERPGPNIYIYELR